MSENLFYPLFLFSVYFFIQFLWKKSLKWEMLAGIFIGLTILTRIIGFVFLFAIPVFFLIKIIAKNHSRRLKVLKLFFLSLVSSWKLFFIIFLVISPWLLRNIYLFGLTLRGLTGYGTVEKVSSTAILHQNPINFIWSAMQHTSYIVFGSGILLFTFSIFLILTKYEDKKLFDLLILSYCLIFFLVIFGAFWSFRVLKLMGRYVAPGIPLILIIGSIIVGHQNFKIGKKMLFSTILTSLFLFSLPIDRTIASFNSPSTYLIFTFPQLHKLGFISEFLMIIIIKVILLSFPFILLIFYEKILLKKRFIIISLLSFFIFISALGTLGIYLGSTDASEEMEFALWIHSNIKDDKIILLDERLVGVEKDLFWIEEALRFWTNNNVLVDDFIKTPQKADYVISVHKLDLELVTKIETKEGVFDPTEKIIYFYKNNL